MYGAIAVRVGWVDRKFVDVVLPKVASADLVIGTEANRARQIHINPCHSAR
jgi:hypothetical protein